MSSGENYFSIVSKVDSIIGTDSSITTNGGFKEYLRWKSFWLNRINSDGNFKDALEVMHKYAMTPRCSTPDNLTSDWELVGPNQEPVAGQQHLGIINSLYMDPNDNNFVLAGSMWGGIFLSTNATSGTPTWRNLLMNTKIPQIGITSIVVNPTNRNEVWASVGFQYGLGIIYCSDISVQSPQWEFIEPNIFPLDQGIIEADLSVIQKIIIHPDFANTPILYAITGREVYRIAKNANGSFTSNTESFSLLYPNARLKDLEFDPNDSNSENIIVSGNGIWRLDYFTIGGWEELFDPSISIGNAKIAVDGNNIYAFYLSNYDIVNFKFLEQNIAKFNSAQNWNLIYNQTNSTSFTGVHVYPGTLIFEVNENAGNPIFYAEGGVGIDDQLRRKVVRSIGGLIWTIQSSYSGIFNGTYTHADIRSIQLVEKSAGGNSDKILIGNDGGMLYANLTGAQISWTNINGIGLANNLFNGIDISEKGELITAGAQDNGFFRFYNNSWNLNTSLGDGGQTEINENCNSEECYSYDTQKRLINRFANIITSLSNNTTSSVNESALFERPVFLDKNKNLLYAGFHNLYFYKPNLCNQNTALTLIGSYNFTTNNGVPTGVKMVAVAVSTSNPEVIYVAFQGWNYSQFDGTRLFQSIDGGVTFSDISLNLNQIDLWSISEIVIDERDPNHIWLGFSGIGYDPSGVSNESVARVVEGTFDGTDWTWVDVSEGLPEFPINCMEYENGSKGAIYVGTDNGVFYRNDNMTEWECFNNNLPLGMVTDLTINYCEGKIYASVYGNAIWKSPLATSPKEVIQISGNEEWYGYRTINTDVFIPDGKSLKIYQNGTHNTVINFSKNYGITVEPGGKLEIIDATLTSACGSWWQGINAMGQEFESQTTVEQPFIKITNSNIENAYIAVRGGKPASNPDQTVPNGGAIVQVNNSIFKNNWIDIQFMPFHRMVTLNGNDYEMRNLSYVKNSHFITDADLSIPNHIDPLTHIQMTDINGIEFRYNIFESTRTGITLDNAGIGIMALDAKFNVIANCSVPVPFGGQCPTPNMDGNEFRNLFAGIYSGQGTGYSNIKVDGNLFEDCVYGMYLGGTNYNTITRNTFKVPQGDDSFTDPLSGFTYKAAFGIYMQSAFGNKIEENIFENANTTGPHRNLGVYSENGGIFRGNKVYRNDFTDLTYSVQTSENNQLLDIDCNRFNKYANTFADIHVATGDLKDQGFCHPSDRKQPQANEFYGACDNIGNFQIHKNPIALPFEYNSYPMSGVGIDINNCVNNSIIAIECTFGPSYQRSLACPSTIATSGINVLPLLRSTIFLEREIVSQLKSQVDGGNTESLLTAINGSMNSGQLKNLLMQHSPYLSDKVLISAINRTNSMSPGHLKQILLENSPLTEAVLYNLILRPLPPGHMNQIMNSQVGESARAELDDEIKFHDATKLYALNEMVAIYLDTNWVDSAMVALQNDGSMEAICLLLPVASKKDTIIVKDHIEILRDIASEEELWYPLNKTTKELEAFCDFHESLYNIKNRGGSYFSMKTNERQNLLDIAHSLTSVAIYANSVLDFTNNIKHYFPDAPFIYDNGIQRSVMQIELAESNALLKAYPNPFEGNTTIEYNLNDEVLNGYLAITDLTGKEILRIQLKDKNSALNLIVNSVSGIYLATLFNNDKPMQTIKLVLF